MTGRAVALNGKDWIPDVVEHWPPGGPDDRPLAYDVFFYDPGDPHQWIGHPWVRADAVDLSTDGLRRLARGATLRSWRDARNTYWRIQIFRAGTLDTDTNGGGVRMPDGLIAFAPRDASEGRIFTRMFAELPPLGELGDEELERLTPRPGAHTPLSEALGPDRVRRRQKKLAEGRIPLEARENSENRLDHR